MSITAETLVLPPPSASDLNLDAATSDRRADVDAKQSLVAAMLQTIGRDGLVALEPENFSWLTSGATPRGILDPAELPALYFGPEQRWLISSNADTQRLFDEEIDGLGFLLKEWPWYWGREQLLSDLCQNRRLASDRPLADAQLVNDRLRPLRLSLSVYEQACCRALGQLDQSCPGSDLPDHAAQ